MKKFWTVVLRIVMFLSFAGIIVFSCIAVISSNNIAYEAYNYLTVNMASLELDDFGSNVNRDVRASHGGSEDPYVSYLTTFILDTKNTFSYYLDYLALDDVISKGEQNVLIDDFKSCLNAKNDCKATYDSYMIAYSKATEGTENAEEYVKTFAREFIYEYAELYNRLATLQLDLYKATKINVVKVESFDFQKNIVMTGLSSAVVKDLYNEENIKKDSSSRALISENANYQTYASYKEKIKSYSNKRMVLDARFQSYVYNLNALDIFSWAKDYDNYLLTLNNALREKATNAKAFFDESFK